MCIADEPRAEQYLRHVNYYRLGAYWLPFETDHVTHQFAEGTELDRVIECYTFDRLLRLHVLDAIERIEVSIRSQWAHHMGMLHGPHAHLNPTLAKDRRRWERNLQDLHNELHRSYEQFVRHFESKYDDSTPPVWAVCEVMSLGLLSKWFANLKPSQTRKLVCQTFEIDHEVAASWLHHLSHVRNICAHHSRLWNRELTVTPMMPRTKPLHLVPEMKPQSRGIYNTLVIINHMLSIIEPDTAWKKRLVSIIEDYHIDPKHMDFPTRDCSLLLR